MAKLTLLDPTTNFQSTSQIAANNQLIETAFENTLSLDGTTPNAMSANFDMNGYSILNVANVLSTTAITALADDATPSVAGGRVFTTGGTTTITDFDDGVTGQEIVILAEHAITITDGTNIILHGSANFVMAASDSLTLIQKSDTKWYEVARMVNL